MIDKRTFELMRIFNEEVDSGYKIFSKSELSENLPQRYSTDSEGVSNCIKKLVSSEYISVKYEDKNEVCVSVLAEGRRLFDKEKSEKKEKDKERKQYFRHAFWGAFLGGAFVLLIAFLVTFFLGWINVK